MKLFTEAEKKAQVSKIEWEQKITEKESQKRISQIEGIVFELALMEKHVFTLMRILFYLNVLKA